MLKRLQGPSEEASLEKKPALSCGDRCRWSGAKAYTTVTRDDMGALISLCIRVIKKTSFDQILSDQSLLVHGMMAGPDDL